MENGTIMKENRKQLLFLKLGGSLLTDKSGVEALRGDVLRNLAAEIKTAKNKLPQQELLLGHGSGSFGHVAAAEFGTRASVSDARDWMGYARVSDAAARLNREVCAALLEAGISAVSLQPSASAQCEDGRIVQLASRPIVTALRKGLVPVVYGDVAFDAVRGGTIISTEEIMSYLAAELKPSWILLAGETDGVLDLRGQPIPILNEHNLAKIEFSLGGSRGTDVTGGMLSKVKSMLELVDAIDGLSVRVFSGLQVGNVREVLLGHGQQFGTVITRTGKTN